MKNHIAPAGLAATAALALLAGTTAPAAAAALTVTDGDDSAISADIDTVRVVHRVDRIRVTVSFDDLVEDARERTQGISVFFDTDAADRGPEFRLGGGLNSGTDYQLSRVEGWSSRGRFLRRCDYLGRISWTRDTVTYLVDPPCFGDVESLAVAVKAGESTRRTGERTDWLGEERAFAAPVSRG